MEKAILIPMSAWIGLLIWMIFSSLGTILMRKISSVNWMTFNLYLNITTLIGACGVIGV